MDAHSEAAIVGTLKIRSGSMGAATRDSTKTNTAMSARPPIR